MQSRPQSLRNVLLSALCILNVFVSSLWAQPRLTVDQLYEFVQSSIRAKHPDKQVAAYLLKYKLSQRLDARTIEELQGLGAGPATMESLRKMVEGSASLPEPPPKDVKAPTPVIDP